MRRRSSQSAVVALVSICMFGVTSAGVQCQADSDHGYGGALACIQPSIDPAAGRGPAPDKNSLFGNMTFESRWKKSLVPVTSDAARNRNTSSSAGSFAVGNAVALNATWGLQWPASMQPELGSNDLLSLYAGYFDSVGNAAIPTVGAAGGSIAFIAGNPLGLPIGVTAASTGADSLYRSRTNLYRRDLGLGSIGGDVDIGRLGNRGAANFASNRATFEGYAGDFTPFAGAGAFGAQGSLARALSPLSK